MQADGHRFRALDGWRGLCACMVVFYHLHTSGRLTNLALVGNSWLFVDFFFVLSGFVIATGYRRRIGNTVSVRRFMLLRFARLYPLHLGVLALMAAFPLAGWLLLGRAQPLGGMPVDGLLASLAFVQPIAGPSPFTWNVPSWSIAAEWWTYLAFAAAAAWRGWPGRTILAAALVALPLTWALRAPIPEGVQQIARCAYGFACGALAEAWLLRPWLGSPLGRRAATLLEIATILVLGTLIVWGGATLLPVFGIAFALAVLLFAREAGLVSAGLRGPVSVALGDLSYSIYMIHFLVIFRITGLLDALGGRWTGLHVLRRGSGELFIDGRPLAADLFALATLALVIGCAALSRRFVERPGGALLRQVFGLHPVRQPVVAAADTEAAF